MTIEEINRLGDRNVLALTLDGEAEGEPIDGMIAVGCVIRNRLRANNPLLFGKTYADVCLKHAHSGNVLHDIFQFSCWQEQGGGHNYVRLMARAAAIDIGQTPSDPPFRQCLFVAGGIISGELLDNVAGATHYVTEALERRQDAPSWVKQAQIVTRRGSQVFLR